MLADLCPCFHQSSTRPNFGRSRIKVCPILCRLRTKLCANFGRSRARLYPISFAPCPFPNLAGTLEGREDERTTRPHGRQYHRTTMQTGPQGKQDHIAEYQETTWQTGPHGIDSTTGPHVRLRQDHGTTWQTGPEDHTLHRTTCQTQTGSQDHVWQTGPQDHMLYRTTWRAAHQDKILNKW